MRTLGASTCIVLGAFFATCLGSAAPAHAEHFEIALTIRAAKDQATAHADTDPPAQGVDPRPVCHANRGEELVFEFFFTSNFPHGTKKGVIVRYFIAPEKSTGHKDPPDASKPAVMEGKFVMDFKPDGKVGIRQRIRIDAPGAYIVRVESQNSDSDHEHFAAIDLVVE